MIGRVVQNYKIISLIGEGGMGSVYKALDFKLDRYVAIKVLHLSDQRNTLFVERFKLEARNQAKLSHPNIVSVYGFVEARDFLGFVMELIEGKTVEDYIGEYGRLSLYDSIQILKQALIGIAYAHSEGFIHRDLKPSNIIIDTKGVVKITDFGIAKSVNQPISITKTGAKVGTVLYMSPEQIRGYEPTVKSDLYSIAVSFYEMISGRVPYNFNSEYEILDAHLNNIPVPLSETFPEIPSQVDQVILRGMNKASSGNYNHCTDFLYDLEVLESSLQDINYQDTQTYDHIEISAPIKKNNLSKRIFNFFLFTVFVSLLIFSVKVVTDYLIEQKEKTEKDNEKSMISPGPFSEIKSDWSIINTGYTHNFNSLLPIRNNRILIFGDNGIIVSGNLKDLVWERKNSTVSTNIYSAAVFNNSGIVAVGERGMVLVSLDMGQTWLQKKTGISETLFKVTFIDNKIYSVGTNGTIIVSNNFGESWAKLNSPTNKIIYDIHFIDKMNCFTAGWEGQIMHSKDGGISWSLNRTGNDNYLRSITFRDNKLGLAVGGGGKILRTDNGGNDWKLINVNTASAFNRVSFINENIAIAVSGKGEIFRTTDTGLSWTLLQSGVFASLSDLASFPDGQVCIIGSNGTLLTRKLN